MSQVDHLGSLSQAGQRDWECNNEWSVGLMHSSGIALGAGIIIAHWPFRALEPCHQALGARSLSGDLAPLETRKAVLWLQPNLWSSWWVLMKQPSPCSLILRLCPLIEKWLVQWLMGFYILAAILRFQAFGARATVSISLGNQNLHILGILINNPLGSLITVTWSLFMLFLICILCSGWGAVVTNHLLSSGFCGPQTVLRVKTCADKFLF